MLFRIACPHCKKALKVRDEMAGKKGKCPYCGHVLALMRDEGRTAGPQLAEPSVDAKQTSGAVSDEARAGTGKEIVAKKRLEIPRGWFALGLALFVACWGIYAFITLRLNPERPPLPAYAFPCIGPFLVFFVFTSALGSITGNESPRVGSVGCIVGAVIGLALAVFWAREIGMFKR